LKKRLKLFLIGFVVGVSVSFAQSNTVTFKPQFFQVKESFNYGLVNDGLNLGLAYQFHQELGNGSFDVSPQLAIGLNYAKGIGMAFQFRPVDIYRGWEINWKNVVLGPYTSVNYQWQLYPELQSGHMFWFSSMELGSRVKFPLSVGSKKMVIDFSNSMFGLVSRPELQPGQEEYYYSLAASDWIKNVHQNMTFGFNDLFNHTILKVQLVSEKKTKLGYEFEYFGYYKVPEINYMSHSLTMTWIVSK
jgi:hypothetical protein